MELKVGELYELLKCDFGTQKQSFYYKDGFARIFVLKNHNTVVYYSDFVGSEKTFAMLTDDDSKKYEKIIGYVPKHYLILNKKY